MGWQRGLSKRGESKRDRESGYERESEWERVKTETCPPANPGVCFVLSYITWKKDQTRGRWLALFGTRNACRPTDTMLTIVLVLLVVV
ncbi:hypothetical protein PROFUN_16930, partial [Planoprotostelium fungivorum]